MFVRERCAIVRQTLPNYAKDISYTMYKSIYFYVTLVFLQPEKKYRFSLLSSKTVLPSQTSKSLTNPLITKIDRFGAG